MTLLATLFVGGFSQAHGESPEMKARVNEAVLIVKEKQGSDTPIPRSVINNARGIAIIEITKGGFGLSGQHGEGVLIARTASGWSAPSAFNASGGGIGFQVGVEVRKLIFILNNADAVNAFARNEKFKFNAIAQATAGPDTVTEEASTINQHSIYVYSLTDGAFAGAAIGAELIGTNLKVNRATYGDTVSTADIINGKVSRPAYAAPLYSALGLN